MPIVTFTSDFGLSDGYVALVKARILSENKNITIIDISHLVEPANIADGAFILASSFASFPEKSVHLVAVDSAGNPGDGFIALSLDNHFFVGTDNGLFSLISENTPAQIVQLDSQKYSTFPARDIFADAAAKLASGCDILDLGSSKTEFKRLLGRQTKATKKEMAGHIIKVDHFGNLITSIRRSDFDLLSKGKKYQIGFGKESTSSVQVRSNEVEAGDCYVLFNHLGLLEIGIRSGNASELLGLSFDSPVWIKFEQ